MAQDAGAAIRTDGGRPQGRDAGTHVVPDGSAARDASSQAGNTDSAIATPDIDAGGLEPAFDAGWVYANDAGLAREDAGIPPTDAGLAREDAGILPTDAGLAREDAGIPPTDAGTETETWASPPPAGLVASSGYLGREMAISVGRYGAVTIAFSDDSSDSVVLAYGGSGGFRTETVASDVGHANLVAVVRDSSDRLHVGYSSLVTGSIRHAVRDHAGRWQHQALVSRFTCAPRRGSLAVDTSGNPRFAYAGTELSDSRQSLVYSAFDGSAWSSEAVDREYGFSIGENADLKLDAHGVPHITYLDFTVGLRYARWTGTSWDSDFVPGARGEIMPLALDSEGVPTVAYTAIESMGFTTIKRVVVARGASTGWTTEVVYEGDSAVKAFAIDHLNHPHLLYTTSMSDRVLHYARKRGRTWEDFAVGTLSFGTALDPAVLAIDARGNAHIAYQEWVDGDVNYAFVAAPPTD